MKSKWELHFPGIKDARGELVALEGMRNIPFAIKRVYYVTVLQPGASRGFHAHKTLHQVAICVSGSCRFILEDKEGRETVLIDNPSQGIEIPPMVWHEMHDFTQSCVLMVLASDFFDPSDYIRDHSQFRSLLEDYNER